jgi:nucleoside-diphosphate-sugar epimerase
VSFIKRLLVTDDVGYIGSVLTTMLQEKSYEVRGYGLGYFNECLLYPKR